MSTVMQGVDYLADPADLLFVRSEVAAVETPVLDALAAEHPWFYWSRGTGAEPIEWSERGEPLAYDVKDEVAARPVADDGKVMCPRCSRRVKPRRDGEPVRHKAGNPRVWCE